jgi:hypothetical protein
MELQRWERKYVPWAITAPTGAVLEVTFDDAVTWYPLTVADGYARVLVAGPDATGNPAGTVVLGAGQDHRAHVRATVPPEAEGEYAGVVTILP